MCRYHLYRIWGVLRSALSGSRDCAYHPGVLIISDWSVQVRSRCEPILRRFNFHWPTSLDCDGLPSHSTREDLCIEPPGEHDSFPGDDPEFDSATELFHHPSGTALSTLKFKSKCNFKQQHFRIKETQT